MKSMRIGTLMLAALSGLSATGATIVSWSPPGNDDGAARLDAVVLAASWTSASEYQNVSISVWLRQFSQPPSANAAVEAYLMTQIGPGTTAASEIASGVINANLVSDAWTLVPLFSNITLPAGTNHLVLHAASFSPVPLWAQCTTCTASTAPGVTLNIDQAASPNGPAYRPESTFSSAAQTVLAYSVTGDAVSVSAVPEPSSIFLAAPILIGLLLRSRRRR